MLRELDLSVSLEKEPYKKQLDALTLQIGQLQRQAREAGLPVLVAVEGWEASGKGTQINQLVQALDPRGYTVHAAVASEEESMYPYWRRFWNRTPAAGRVVVFDRGWCQEAIDCMYRKNPDKDGFERACREINAFERQLADEGTLIVKFFLHISRKEQKRRFAELEDNSSTAWKVSKQDHAQNRAYSLWRDAAQAVLERTDTESARWHLVEAEDRRFATVKILGLFADALQEGLRLKAQKAILSDKPARKSKKTAVAHLPEDMRSSRLDMVDLSLSLSDEAYSRELSRWQERLHLMEHEMYRKRVPLMVLYEGWDAAGKGGNIRRLTAPLDPRGYEVIPVSAPNEVERAHHYLWRFWRVVPKAGHIAILDRTWYGRVLVERVEGFCTEAQWSRAYREINEMEEELAQSGVALVKFWLHIDKEEQLRRFEERQSLEWKNWKITEEDWRNREKWDAYHEACDEMLFRTSTTHAPWTVIEANDKRYARVKALRTIVETMENRM